MNLQFKWEVFLHGCGTLCKDHKLYCGKKHVATIQTVYEKKRDNSYLDCYVNNNRIFKLLIMDDPRYYNVRYIPEEELEQMAVDSYKEVETLYTKTLIEDLLELELGGLSDGEFIFNNKN